MDNEPMHDEETGEIFDVPAVHLETSRSLAKLIGALAKAQGKIENATKDAQNPAFKSRYATLAAVLEAARLPLSENAIAVIQVPFNAGPDIGVATILAHESGEWIKGTLQVQPVKFDAQGAGSVITYLRRYLLMSLVGIAPADDDGEAAVGRPAGTAPAPARQQTATRAAQPAAAAPDAKRDVARAKYETIVRRLRTAPHEEALDNVVRDGTADLAEIKAYSEEAYTKLMDIVGKNRDRLRAAAAEAGEEMPA
jgi:hypothetical protein